MKSELTVKTPLWNTWIVVPLRLFLGVTFIYAGIQKLTDPQYFDPAQRGSIGHQIAAFATGSPLRSFLLDVVLPHAALFGALVAYGELAIGLGALLGLLLRAASLCGLLVNLIFFLSADWHVFPYFYGSDIVFLFCWLTLLIAGPANQALPAPDVWLVRRLVEGVEPARQPARAALCVWLFGVQIETAPLSQTPLNPAGQPDWGTQKAQPVSQYHTWQFEQARRAGRRNFVFGSLSGGALVLVLAVITQALHILPGSNTSEAGAATPTPITPTLGSPVTGDTPTVATGSNVIAQINNLPPNSSANFTLPSNNDPGILVHLNNGQFVAFDATCTHAGCPVDYDPSVRQLVCPCHGAAFDPTRSAAVINGPAQTPLTSVKIKVDQSTGTISLS
ncbi:MAG TPA: TQO small subunit DoxD [Ktedonobacteraceae bacterium]